MASPMDLFENLEALDMEDIAIKTLETHESTIADLNATQMAQGRRADGSEITPDYADLTIELKQGRPGLAGVTDRVTLFDEGDHYRELYADIEGRGIEMGSRNSKSEALQKKYGDIYGLNEDSKEELKVGFTKPTSEQLIEEATGLKFN